MDVAANVAHTALNVGTTVVTAPIQITDAAVHYVAPGFQDTIVNNLPGPVQDAWSVVSSPVAFTEGFVKGGIDGVQDVVNETIDQAAGASKCVADEQCRVNAVNAVSSGQVDLPKALGDMAKGLEQAGQDAYKNFTDKISGGDWNGAGKDAGHAAVAVGQIASIVVGGIGAIKGLTNLPSFLRNLPNLLKGGAGAEPAFPAALTVGNNARTGISVYKGLDKLTSEWIYSGITNNPLRRAFEHILKFDLREIGSGLTWGQARAIEQALILANKARKAATPPANLINSISPARAYYDAAVKWGEWWLRKNQVNIR